MAKKKDDGILIIPGDPGGGLTGGLRSELKSHAGAFKGATATNPSPEEEHALSPSMASRLKNVPVSGPSKKK